MAQASAYAGARQGDVRTANTHPFQRYIKRIADIMLSLPLFVLALPWLVLAALIIRCDGGPAFFGHQRVGRNGALFTCWKLRTMRPDSEACLHLHLAKNPKAREEWEASRKLSHDPRVTRFGRLLRRSSLDELPQLWNVLRGDMSLVGPRPVVSDELDLYGVFRQHYMAVRPGITGKWQISGRNSVSYADRVALDVAYVTQHNLIKDMLILAQTLIVVVRMTGK